MAAKYDLDESSLHSTSDYISARYIVLKLQKSLSSTKRSSFFKVCILFFSSTLITLADCILPPDFARGRKSKQPLRLGSIENVVSTSIL